jgi:superfamily II DNA or RNA helicase
VNLRDWQSRAIEAYDAAGAADFLLVATPGAGKTYTAMAKARRLLDAGVVVRVVVVCPTSELRSHWGRSAAAFGIQLDYAWGGDCDEARDYSGLVTTYQQVLGCAFLLRRQCSRPTLVIFDEIHHASESKAWGEALLTAFSPAVRRLAISGTPFREDGKRIPFVRYENNRSVAGFSYGYPDALGEGVVRPVAFPSYEGRMEWVASGGTVVARFEDDLGNEESSRRLRTALLSNGWVGSVLSDADQKLSSIREEHRNAGGLVLAMDMNHAKQISSMLPGSLVVVSEDPDAETKLKSFRAGDQRWLVSVRMVSEGVDIPRLRVLVYATNYLTEMFFRQAMGRIVRWTDGIEEQTAYFFIPKEPTLVEYAQRIMQERDAALRESVDRALADYPDDIETERQRSLFAPLGAEAHAAEVYYHEQGISQEEMARADSARRASGVLDITTERAALLLRAAGRPASAPPPPTVTTPPLRDEKDKLRKAIQKMVGSLSYHRGWAHKDTYMRLMSIDGAKQEEATMPQLKRRAEQLKSWLSDGK